MIFKKTLFIASILCSFAQMYSMHIVPTVHIERSKDLPKVSLTHHLRSYDTHLSLDNQLYRQRLKATSKCFVKAPCLATLAIGGITICSSAVRCAIKSGITQNLLSAIAQKAAIVVIASAAVATVGTLFNKLVTRNVLRDHRQAIANQRADIVYTYSKRARRIKNFGELQDFVATNETYNNSETRTLAADLKTKAREQLETWQQLLETWQQLQQII